MKELYKYRELFKSNVKKEIRGKYKGSFLGVLWSFVNPLLSVMIYAIVFPLILKNNQDNYVTYLVVGILPWTWFTTSISQGTYCILANAGIIKKVYFPREILPISIVMSGMVNFLISCLVIVVFLIFSNIWFSWYLIVFPLIVLVQFLISLGFIFFTSAINVFVRDAEYIINFLISMLFYVTPILYADKIIPAKMRWIIDLNPMATIINSYRDIMFYKQMPDMLQLSIVALVSILLTTFGFMFFKKMEKGFAEEV